MLTVGQRLLLRLRAGQAAVAGWWVGAEAVRDRWPYAFPWGRLAMSQAGAPTARWAAVGGAPLLTFLLALAGACLAWLLLGRRSGPGAELDARVPLRTILTLADRLGGWPEGAISAATAAALAFALASAALARRRLRRDRLRPAG